jgi:hypothetical protein
MLRLPATAEEQRIAILWTPRIEVLEELLAAEDTEQRSAIVGLLKRAIDSWKSPSSSVSRTRVISVPPGNPRAGPTGVRRLTRG